MRGSLNLLETSRKIHKWLMLFIGAQFVIWSVTGTYMVFFDIHYIHGDTLVTTPQIKLKPENIKYQQAQLFTDFPGASDISLGTLTVEEVYRFRVDGRRMMVSALDGRMLTPLSEAHAVSLARAFYTGDDEVERVQLITENPPFEFNPRGLPAWRVDFDNFAAPSIYIQAETGELVGKRHTFWRLFDWMFRFHVMDYSSGENIGNALLLWLTLSALLATLAGFILAYVGLFRRRARRVMSADKPHQGVS